MSPVKSEPKALPYGPVMIDIVGLELTDLDRERLCHPLVGGLILFARNYQSPEQLRRLTAEVHALRTPPLPIAIDHEGGRVQRCREGFTRLPAMRRLGALWESNREEAVEAARSIGFVLAAELRLNGVDLSFTPVLDLDWGRCSAIGTRAFHCDPSVVVELAGALIEGLHDAGMGACGKHFPGHGWAEADSHYSLPVDERDLAELATDMAPYRQLKLDGVMPAHVIFPKIDSRTAGFSPVWIGKLRDQFGFDGVVFSDDLSMRAAGVAGDIVGRVEAAWEAGCDMLLVCNSTESAGEVLERWHPEFDPVRSERIGRLVPKQPALDAATLRDDPRYVTGVRFAQQLAE